VSTGDVITLELSRGEAIVLFEWLKALEERAGVVGHLGEVAASLSAERIVTWKLESQLDKALAEPLSEDYLEVLANARRLVVASVIEE